MCYIMVHMEGSNRKTGMLLRVCTLLRKDMDGKKNKEIMDLRYNIQLLVLGGAGEHPSCHEWEVGYTLYSWTVHHRTNTDRPQLTATPTANLKTTRPDLGYVGGTGRRFKLDSDSNAKRRFVRKTLMTWAHCVTHWKHWCLNNIFKLYTEAI